MDGKNILNSIFHSFHNCNDTATNWILCEYTVQAINYNHFVLWMYRKVLSLFLAHFRKIRRLYSLFVRTSVYLSCWLSTHPVLRIFFDVLFKTLPKVAYVHFYVALNYVTFWLTLRKFFKYFLTVIF